MSNPCGLAPTAELRASALRERLLQQLRASALREQLSQQLRASALREQLPQERGPHG